MRWASPQEGGARLSQTKVTEADRLEQGQRMMNGPVGVEDLKGTIHV
jgi:hypothetical protein